MIAIETIINRVRSLAHDVAETGYSDDEILFNINAGIRFINRIIKDIKPELLMDFPATGQLNAGENTICINKPMLAVIAVRANGRALKVTSPLKITNMNDTAENPTAYYLCGFDKLALYPIPTKPTDYAVFYVPDTEEVTIKGKSPFPNDFDDALIEYVIIRMSIGNEFDMSQEFTVMQTVTDQVQSLISNFPSPEHRIKGYFDDDYDDRYTNDYGNVIRSYY